MCKCRAKTLYDHVPTKFLSFWQSVFCVIIKKGTPSYNFFLIYAIEKAILCACFDLSNFPASITIVFYSTLQSPSPPAAPSHGAAFNYIINKSSIDVFRQIFLCEGANRYYCITMFFCPLHSSLHKQRSYPSPTLISISVQNSHVII